MRKSIFSNRARCDFLVVGLRLGRGDVVVAVAVQRPEVLGEVFERLGQRLVRRRGGGPQRRSAIARQGDGAQDRRGRVVRDERHVGVPAVGLAVVGVDRRDDRHVRPAAPPGGRWAYRCGRRRHAVGVVEVVLVAEEDHLVAQQRFSDVVDGVGVEIAGQSHAVDAGADAAAQLGHGHDVDVDVRVAVMTTVLPVYAECRH